jgi:hypothetical protein
MVGDQSAIAIRLLVTVPNGGQAEICQVVPEFG